MSNFLTISTSLSMRKYASKDHTIEIRKADGGGMIFEGKDGHSSETSGRNNQVR